MNANARASNRSCRRLVVRAALVVMLLVSLAIAAGFAWFQGWNDAIGEGNPNYVDQMAHFIRDMRKDLKAPKMPFVIGELGTDGPGAVFTLHFPAAALKDLPQP